MSSSAGPGCAADAALTDEVAVEYTVENDEMLAREMTAMSLGERKFVPDDFVIVRRSAIMASRFYKRNYLCKM